MLFIDGVKVEKLLSFKDLISELDKGFSKNYSMPARQVFELDSNHNNHDAFAVLPAWNDEVIGVKAFTYFPENQEETGLKSLYSNIMLFSRSTGEPLAILDGSRITYWRTACISALASRYLSREDSQHLLFLGTGNLAPYMIAAHLSVRKLTQVSIWGRNEEKAKGLIDECKRKFPNVDFSFVDSIEESASKADIISCATGSGEPLILGEWLTPGCHIDLVGNHHKDKRECDSNAVSRSRVFADSRVNVMNEAGELLIPISEELVNESHLLAELSDLTKGFKGRDNATDITLFKSVGTALSDLLAANLVLEKFKQLE